MIESYALFVGAITGVVMGAIGIGAGLISIPLLIMVGLTIKEAVAVAMVMQLFPQSIFGVMNYWDDIRWMVSTYVILGSAIGIWLGSYLVKHNIISEKYLYRAVTLFLFFASIYFYRKYW